MNKRSGFFAGLALAASLIPLAANPARATDYRPVQVDVDLLCEGQQETEPDGSLVSIDFRPKGSDEIYVPVSVVKYSNGRVSGKSYLVYSGQMRVSSITGRRRCWAGQLRRGETVAITYSVFEADAGSTLPGRYVAELLKTAVARAFLYGHGPSSLAPSIGRVPVDGILGQVAHRYRWADADDYIGTFTVCVSYNHDGTLTSTVDPSRQALFLGNGRLVLYGSGAAYYPGVDVNGVRVGQHHRF